MLPTLMTIDDNWRKQAACLGHDPEMFDPVIDPTTKREAVAICGGCPVIAECLDAALQMGPTNAFGIWGGTDDSERLAIRQRRRDRGSFLRRARRAADG